MPITTTKTLHGVEYVGLYSTIEPIADIGSLAVFDCKVYQTVGHYQDGFLPIIFKREVITNQPALMAYRSLSPTDYPAAIAAIEAYIVGQAGFHQGGVVS
jgi:hypothetical protein